MKGVRNARALSRRLRLLLLVFGRIRMRQMQSARGTLHLLGGEEDEVGHLRSQRRRGRQMNRLQLAGGYYDSRRQVMFDYWPEDDQYVIRAAHRLFRPGDRFFWETVAGEQVVLVLVQGNWGLARAARVHAWQVRLALCAGNLVPQCRCARCRRTWPLAVSGVTD